MDRRTFVQTSLASAGTLALAGCSDLRNNGGNGNGDGTNNPWGDLENPAYANWIPNSDQGQFFSHIDFQALNELEEESANWGSGGTGGDGESSEQYGQYGLAAIPLSGAVAAMFGSAFGLIAYPFGQDLFPSAEGEAPDGVDTQTITITDDAMVFHGEYDKSVFESEYTTTDGLDGEKIERFEKSDERDGFDIYIEGSENTGWTTEGTLAYAVSDSTVVLPTPMSEDESSDTGEGENSDSESGPSRVELLNTLLDRSIGDEPQIIDVFDGEFLLGHMNGAHVVTGVWNVQQFQNETDSNGGSDDGEDTETQPDVGQFEDVGAINNAAHLAGALTFEGENTTTLDFAAVYDEDTVPTESDLNAELITADTSTVEYSESDITIADNRVALSATVAGMSDESGSEEDGSGDGGNDGTSGE